MVRWNDDSKTFSVCVGGRAFRAEWRGLLGMNQVILTPHVATGTLESLHAKAAFYGANIRRVLAREKPEGLLAL